MKSTIKLFAVLVLALAVFTQSSSVSAGGGQAFNFKGKSAVAQFSSFDPSGCIGTDVYLFGSEAVSKSGPGSPRTPIAQSYVYISRYDYCTGTLLLSADGTAWAPDAGFSIDRRLRFAAVETSIPMYDYVSGASFQVDVSVTWTALGALTRQNSHDHFQSPGCRITTRRIGTSRFAEASAYVSDGVTNYTPDTSYQADISSLKSGTVMIGCTP